MMTRVLMACFLAVMLIQPSAAGTASSDLDQRAIHQDLREAIERGDVRDAMALFAHAAAVSGGSGCDFNKTVAKCLGLEEIRRDIEARVGSHFRPSNIAIGPFQTKLAAFNKPRGNFSQCNQLLGRAPDVQCVLACDASKESCDKQCSSKRATCLAQCLGIGFGCDYACHAAFYVCRAGCDRAHGSCVGNCPERGGEKASISDTGVTGDRRAPGLDSRGDPPSPAAVVGDAASTGN